VPGTFFTYNAADVFANTFFINPATKKGTDKMIELPNSASYEDGMLIMASDLITVAKVDPAFVFKNGGSSASYSAGRFSLDYLRTKENSAITNETMPVEPLNLKTGGRCVILIKDQEE
jgi:hypothetical protein